MKILFIGLLAVMGIVSNANATEDIVAGVIVLGIVFLIGVTGSVIKVLKGDSAHDVMGIEDEYDIKNNITRKW